jgi:hypothetical protein
MNVLGAYYPAWLLCIVAGVVAAVLIRLVLLKFGVEHALRPAALAYPALIALVAFAGWLLFF